jgi:hypothetical protein
MKDSIKEVNSIFEQPWWLDAVAPNAWDCLEIKENDHVVARWPMVKRKRLGFALYGMPSCTQTLGPWVECKQSNYVKALTRKKDLYEALLNKIPSGKNIDVVLDCSVNYFLPYRWAGFRIEPTLSYRFSNLSDLDSIFRGIKDSRKTIIKNASKKLIVKEETNVEIIIEQQRKTFGRQGRSLPIPEETIRRIDEACKEHHASFMLVAYDDSGNIHGASYFVYDNSVCYYLMSGSDPEFRNSGAGSLLIWEGIKKASMLSVAFDFEGSNIMDIERNFRTFGAPFVVNYRVCKLNPILEAFDYFKPKIKKLIGYKI